MRLTRHDGRTGCERPARRGNLIASCPALYLQNGFDDPNETHGRRAISGSATTRRIALFVSGKRIKSASRLCQTDGLKADGLVVERQPVDLENIDLGRLAARFTHCPFGCLPKRRRFMQGTIADPVRLGRLAEASETDTCRLRRQDHCRCDIATERQVCLDEWIAGSGFEPALVQRARISRRCRRTLLRCNARVATVASTPVLRPHP